MVLSRIILAAATILTANAACYFLRCKYGYKGFLEDSRDKREYYDVAVELGKVKVDGQTLSPTGLAHSRVFKDVLYFINGGVTGDDAIYVLDATTGKVTGSIKLLQSGRKDWQDIAVGACPHRAEGSCIFIQESGSLPSLTLLVVEEPDNPVGHVEKSLNLTFTLTAEGVTESKSLFTDCDGNLFFFNTVDFNDAGAVLYQVDLDLVTVTAVAKIDLPTVDTIPSGPLGASMSSDCSKLLVKMPDKIYYFPVKDGVIRNDQVQVLPYLGPGSEEAIDWDPWSNRYYLLSKDNPAVLMVGDRSADALKPSFTLGRYVGSIDNRKAKEISGLAASRLHSGFAYAMTRFGNYNLLVVQVNTAQSVGLINTGISKPTLNFRDIATGVCPASILAESCVYISSYEVMGSKKHKVYVFAEPPSVFGDRQLTAGDVKILEYSLPSGYTSSPRAIMIGRDGEIYMTNYSKWMETVTVFQMVVEGGGGTMLLPIASFVNKALMDGPEAIDMSPCFDEILVKFWDSVWLFKITSTVQDAFNGEFTIQPYLPEKEGRAIAYISCNSYVTTAETINPAPLMVYNRI